MRAHAMIPQIELISVGAFLLAASAGTHAIYENYRGSARDSIAAVSQAVTRKTDQCKIIAVSNLLAQQLCSRLHFVYQSSEFVLRLHCLVLRCSSRLVWCEHILLSERASKLVDEKKCEYSSFTIMTLLKPLQTHVAATGEYATRNAASNKSIQQFVASSGAASVAAVNDLFKSMQAVFQMEYLTVVNATTHTTMYTVNNNGAHAGELYNPGGESPANGFLPTALCQRLANGFFSQRLFLTTASVRQ
jgi:hypothetical protein